MYLCKIYRMFDNSRNRIDVQRELIRLENERLRLINTIEDSLNRGTITQEEYSEKLREINESHERTKNLIDDSGVSTTRLVGITRQLKREAIKWGTATVSVSATLNSIWKTLMEIDRTVRQTTRSFGLAGGRANILRDNIERTSGYALRLGATSEDLHKIYTEYASVTGLARLHSEDTLKNIIDIGRGTGLGVENATKLVALYSLIGVDSRRSGEHVLGILETSERMGISAGNVLDKINTHFRRLSTFTFVQGVKGYAQMASYAEKMRIDMEQALDSAEAARRLENAIEMAAQLQVMGGEFAKTDPFELLFLARNDPARYTEKINEMTGSVISFRKMADGSFEQFLSPADRDRLAGAAKALNMQTDELIKQARRYAEIQHIREQMRGMGLSAEDKDAIEGIATFDAKLGRFTIEIGSIKKDISELSSQQLQQFAAHSRSLEERAKAAQTFDEAFKATIEELKTAFLPMLQGINQVLLWVRPIVIQINEFIKGLGESGRTFLAITGAIMAGAVILKGAIAIMSLMGIPKLLLQQKQILSEISAQTVSPVTTGAGGAARRTTRTAGRGVGRGGLLGAGAGVGLAAVGVGAGINIAAKGISNLADSLKELTPEQAEVLQKIGRTLARTFPLAAVGILAVGLAGKKGSIGIAVVGAAALGLGIAVNLAAKGIGTMLGGLSGLIETSKGAEGSLFKIAGGIVAMTGAMSIWTMGGAGLIGLVTLNATLGAIAKRADDLERVGYAFDMINTVMSGSADDFERIEKMIKTISNFEMRDKTVFSEINDLFKKPLRVEFTDKEVALVTNITLEMDGQKIAEKIGARRFAQITESARVQGVNQ